MTAEEEGRNASSRGIHAEQRGVIQAQKRREQTSQFGQTNSQGTGERNGK